MKQIHSILIAIIVLLLLITIYFKKENFSLDNSISEAEKKIKLLEFAMSSMKDTTNTSTYINNQKKPYKTVYNYY
jgi:uncharacterized protein YoxC